MSDGNRSLVNWMRRNVPPSAAASARASVVLPTPGMSSISRWPRDSKVTIAARIASGLPRTTVATASSSFRTAPMSVDDIGADPRPPRPEVELPEDTGTAGMFGDYSLKTRAAMPVRDATDRRRPWPDVGPGRPVSGGQVKPALAAIVQRHHELQHVPEQRGDGREQHQRGCDERLGREMAHHQAGLIQDVPGHHEDHRAGEQRAETETEEGRREDHAERGECRDRERAAQEREILLGEENRESQADEDRERDHHGLTEDRCDLSAHQHA